MASYVEYITHYIASEEDKRSYRTSNIIHQYLSFVQHKKISDMAALKKVALVGVSDALVLTPIITSD